MNLTTLLAVGAAALILVPSPVKLLGRIAKATAVKLGGGSAEKIISTGQSDGVNDALETLEVYARDVLKSRSAVDACLAYRTELLRLPEPASGPAVRGPQGSGTQPHDPANPGVWP